MSFSLKRVYAIFNKDIKDVSKNMFVLSTVIMPIILAFVFTQSEQVPLGTHYFIINLTFVSITVFVQGAIIAEEKEKNTLRGLMMSPATTIEIITGKSGLSALLTVISLVACMRITGYEFVNEPAIYFAFFMSLILYLAMGTLLGLLTRTVMEASLVLMPLLFVFGMGTLLLEFIANYPNLAFLEYLPNYQLQFLAETVNAGQAFTDVIGYLIVIAAWMVILCILTVVVYRKRVIDGK
ncbi:ABC transporter permease [Aquibacillus koreensis]|uniref:ABC transporter permease n=1 Tax=Aquibacillus koreensis TaxID=279446 RepID=A0A9X4AK81_9BACI|nr:ABC transporter permease [Aquibacillus koreensis]MCT2537850.1 ABC transporter permease [Aquibacillus koreensis]MDC3421118.1 ABC transporter permease [Aquibacillus koreensis]